jgi:hypothetical protein
MAFRVALVKNKRILINVWMFSHALVILKSIVHKTEINNENQEILTDNKWHKQITIFNTHIINL